MNDGDRMGMALYALWLRGKSASQRAEEDRELGRVDRHGTPISMLTGVDKERAEYQDWLKQGGGTPYKDEKLHRFLADDAYYRKWSILVTVVGIMFLGLACVFPILIAVGWCYSAAIYVMVFTALTYWATQWR